MLSLEMAFNHSTDNKIVLVSDFSRNTSAETLTIHFQKRRNGGGEVESVRMIGKGIALVLFEEKEVADSVLARTHTINGKEAKVERYHPSKVQVFDRVTAKLNVDLQLKLHGGLRSVLQQVQKETKIDWHQATSGFVVSGTLEQLTKARATIKNFLQEDQRSKKESISSRGTCDEGKKALDRNRKQSVKPEVETIQTPKYSRKKHQPSLCEAESDTRATNFVTIPAQTENMTEPVVKDSVAENKASHLSYTGLASDNSGTSSNKSNDKTKAVKMDTSFNFEDTKEVPQKLYSISSEMARFLLRFHSDVFSDLEKYVDVQAKQEADNCKLILKRKPGCRKQFSTICEDFSSFYQKFKESFYQKEVRIEKQSSGEVLQSAINDAQSLLPVLIDAGKDTTSLTIYGCQNNVMCAAEKIQSVFQNGMVAKDSMTCREESKLEFTTNTGIRLSVTKGDITMETVDVIVNAANENLAHGGGVARAIVDKGGKSIQEESSQAIRFYGPIKPGKVAWTSAGTLPCKGIIHAVGPIWKPERGAQCKKILGSAVTESLLMASGFRMKSIAFPPISAGIFGMPAAISAKILFGASLKFADNIHPTYEGINDIRFVIIDDPTFDVFKEEFTARFYQGDSCQNVCTKKKTDSKSILGKENGSTASNTRKKPEEQQKERLMKSKHIEAELALNDVDKHDDASRSSVEAKKHGDSVQNVPRSVDLQPRKVNGRSVSNNKNPETEKGMVEQSNLVVGNGSLERKFEKETQDPIASEPKVEITSQGVSPKPNMKCENGSNVSVDELLSISFQKLAISMDGEETSEVISEEGNVKLCKKEGDEKSAERDDKKGEPVLFKIGHCFLCHTETRQADPHSKKICKIHHFCDGCLLKSLTFCNQCPVCHDVYGIFNNRTTRSVNLNNICIKNHGFDSKKGGKTLEVDTENTGYLKASEQQNLVTSGLNKYAFPDSFMEDSQYSQNECDTAPDAITYPTQPTGHMTWKKYNSKRLPGYESTAIIAVTFAFYDGVQEDHHPRPGLPYKGTKLLVCLPSTDEGVNVLKLFQTAFDARLLFTVRSGPEGNYEVNWSLVKPELCQLNSNTTREGFPDPRCLERLQQELKSKLKGMD